MAFKPFLDPSETKKLLYTDNWPIRRRWLRIGGISILVNCEALLIWTIITGGNSLGVQMFLALLGAGMSLLGFYVFGAVWDDNNKRQNANEWMGRRRYGRPDESEEDDDIFESNRKDTE